MEVGKLTSKLFNVNLISMEIKNGKWTQGKKWTNLAKQVCINCFDLVSIYLEIFVVWSFVWINITTIQ